MTYKEEVCNLLSKGMEITEDEEVRLTELYNESKVKDQGASYIEAYNSYLSSLLKI